LTETYWKVILVVPQSIGGVFATRPINLASFEKSADNQSLLVIKSSGRILPFPLDYPQRGHHLSQIYAS
jgi:hypothetical protein